MDSSAVGFAGANGEVRSGDAAAHSEIALDPTTVGNLTQAQKNKLLNAQTSSGVRRQAPTITQSAAASAGMNSQGGAHGGLNVADLTNRLLAVGEESKADS